MKKFVSLMLVMVMALSLLSVAYAAEVAAGDVTGGASKDVTVAVEGTVSGADTKYAVTITWTNEAPMKFTYNFAETAKTWNPSTHSIDTTVGNPGWDKTKDTVTVVNHSNAQVWVDAYFTNGADANKVTKEESGVTATLYVGATVGTPFDRNAIMIPSAEGKEIGDSSAMATLTKAFTVGITETAPANREGFDIDELNIKIYNSNPADPS